MQLNTPYTADFYKYQVDGSLNSAHEIVPFIVQLIQPRSVADIGCGLGTWLSVFQNHGVEEVLGVDGDYVDLAALKIERKNFLPHDLTQPLEVFNKFDLVISLEVAEHLPNETCESFIDTLTRLSPVVLFSAAIPYQVGDYHINCQWPDHWVELFRRRGYVAFDFLRMKFWQNKNVDGWYAQNMFLFVKESCLESYSELKNYSDSITSSPPILVHPVVYLKLREALEPQNVSIKVLLTFLLEAVKDRLRKKFFKSNIVPK